MDWQWAVVVALGFAAAVIVGLRIGRAFRGPSCGCDDPGACPHAGKPADTKKQKLK